MATSTVEDYVKAIYVLQREAPTGEATVARIAATLGVTKGTVTSMVRKLREAGLADAERYAGIRLTPKGQRLALDVIRRHRIIEVFLVETLGFDWSEVHDEAERLEHAMSAKLLDRLDAFLDHPAIDPHGDPIPDAQGKIAEAEATPLSGAGKGDRVVVARVSDQDPDVLAFAAEHGLRPRAKLSVVDVSREDGSITVKPHRASPVTLPLAAAARILVTPRAD